jgi:hypothetical protein
VLILASVLSLAFADDNKGDETQESSESYNTFSGEVVGLYGGVVNEEEPPPLHASVALGGRISHVISPSTADMFAYSLLGQVGIADKADGSTVRYVMLGLGTEPIYRLGKGWKLNTEISFGPVFPFGDRLRVSVFGRCGLGIGYEISDRLSLEIIPGVQGFALPHDADNIYFMLPIRLTSRLGHRN